MLSTTISWSVTFPLIFTQSQIHMQMSHNHKQSPLKALLNNYRKHYKTHNMGYGNQTIMYDDIEDTPAPLNNTPLNHSIPEQHGESFTKYSKDPNP